MDHPPQTPRLLVSVRDATEATAALAGGAAIIDVKEPSRGSLGMADPVAISEIVSTVAAARKNPLSLPVSAALGETVDWIYAPAIPTIPARDLDFLKLGSSGLADLANWESSWQSVRRAFEQSFAVGTPTDPPPRPQHTPLRRPLQWVAVAYADWQGARAPSPAKIAEAAARAGCSIILLDTWRKDGAALLDWLSPRDLRRWAQSCRSLGLNVAIAGGLTAERLPDIAPAKPDIVGIRSAACCGGRRLERVCEDAVRSFNDSLRGAFQPKHSPSAARHEG